jgi:hypothetical protein
MRQSGHWQKKGGIVKGEFTDLLTEAIATLDVEQAKNDVMPFIVDNGRLDVWSREFFQDICSRIQLV